MRMKSILLQIRTLVARSLEPISNGAAKTKYLSDHVYSHCQINSYGFTGAGAVCLLSARRCFSISPPERHPDDSTTFQIQT